MISSAGFILFFRNKFPGLFQDSDWFFKGSNIHINPYTSYFQLSLTDFQNFPGPVAFFKDFPVLENAIIKFQDFPGFPGPIRTLALVMWEAWTDTDSTFLTIDLPMYFYAGSCILNKFAVRSLLVPFTDTLDWLSIGILVDTQLILDGHLGQELTFSIKAYESVNTLLTIDPMLIERQSSVT